MNLAVRHFSGTGLKLFLTYGEKLSLEIYLFSFVETQRKFIIAELSIRKLGSSSVPKSRYYKERNVQSKKRKAIRR